MDLVLALIGGVSVGIAVAILIGRLEANGAKRNQEVFNKRLNYLLKRDRKEDKE